MAIPVWSIPTGIVSVRHFDEGIPYSMGATRLPDEEFRTYAFPVHFPDGTLQNINVYFAQPEQIYRKKVYPFVTISREFEPAMSRWMGMGQLEYRSGVGDGMILNGVSGFGSYGSKIQAFPYDFTYTISCFHRYENEVQPILSKLLKLFPPLGKLIVFDSLRLLRTYEAYTETPVVNLSELLDPVSRLRGYALTVRVEGELDLIECPYVSDSVTGIQLNIYREDEIS
jgi:hypothetical protein